MLPRSILPTLLLATVLCACAQPAPDSPPAPATPGNCQADPARFAVGLSATPSVIEEARRRAGATRVRVVRPGQAVTMEFDAARLNLEVDAAARVLRARCG